MAIGDAVETWINRPERSIYRFDALDGPAAIRDGLASKATFAPDTVVPPRRWRRAWKLPGRAEVKQLTLPEIADRVFDVFRAGGVAVQVPFPHLALVAGFELLEPAHHEEALRQALDPKWSALIDPIMGLRPRLFRDPERSDKTLSLFIGDGVFMPRADEIPVGRIELSLANGSGEWVEPRLPDWRPAAFYRGQHRLTFASRFDLAPARCELIQDDHYLYELQMQRPGQPKDKRSSADMRLDPVLAKPLGPDDPHMEVQGAAEPDAGYDATFLLLRDGQPHLRIRIVRDERSAALHPEPPRNVPTVLELVGILVPEAPSASRRIKRWWLDLDEHGRIVGGAFAQVAQSVVFAGRSIESYDWRSNRWRTGSVPRFRHESHAIDGRERHLVRRTDQPLGYLVPPERSQRVVFEARIGAPNVYHLDWLDYAGAVQASSGNPERLCGAWAGAVDTLSNLQVPSREEILARAAGGEFFIGPLCVRVRTNR